jgi:hypothetical protein
MLFSRILICPHFLCGQVGFGRGIKPRRYTGTLTLRFAVACLPFGSCNSGEVYEFENGFYDKYRLDQNKYEMNNLQPLPNDNHELWTKPPLDGYKHLR